MIRSATLADIPALIMLEKHCFSQDRLAPRQFRQFLQRDNVILKIAEEEPSACNSPLSGYVLVLLRKKTSQARLYSLAVEFSRCGSGLAKKLLLSAEQQAKARGYKKIILEVREDNQRAIHFYQKLNYHFFGRHENFYEDQLSALRFHKILEEL